MRDRLLTAYRGLAWLTGLALLVLVFVAVPLKYFGGHDTLDTVVGMAHGILFYPAYVIVSFALGYRQRWPLIKIALVVIAGTVPLMSFVAERRVTADLRRAADHAPAAPAPPA